SVDEIWIEIALCASRLRSLILIGAAGRPDLHRGQLGGGAAHGEIRDEPILIALACNVASDRLHPDRSHRQPIATASIRKHDRVPTVGTGGFGAGDSGLERSRLDARARHGLTVETRDFAHQYVGGGTYLTECQRRKDDAQRKHESTNECGLHPQPSENILSLTPTFLRSRTGNCWKPVREPDFAGFKTRSRRYPRARYYSKCLQLYVRPR